MGIWTRSAPDHKLDQLARVPGLDSCRPADLQRVARAGDWTDMEPGHVLISAGDVPRWGYLVVRGTVVVSDGDCVRHEGAGWWAGAAEIALREAAAETTAAGTDTAVLAFSRPRLIGLLEDAPTLALAVVRAMATHVVAAPAPLHTATPWSGRAALAS